MSFSKDLSASHVNLSIDKFINTFQKTPTVYVAFSGGLDSTVLLHALVQSKLDNHRIIAVYIDHGLQAVSAQWAERCAKVCHDLGVEFTALNVDIQSTARKGVEAVARQLRYQALSDVINERGERDSVLVTGHHQRDQAETVLLNLFRGAGVNGLAAMPNSIYLHDNKQSLHCRPLLNIPYSLLVEYAETHQLSFVTDESNHSSVYRRNLVRNEILPKIELTWPTIHASLASTASHMQEASTLLDKYAKKDLRSIQNSKVFVELKDVNEQAWLEQKNIIRYWFKQNWPAVVLSKTHYEWLYSALKNYAKSENQKFSYQLSNGQLRVYKDRIYYLKKIPSEYGCSIGDILELEKEFNGLGSDDVAYKEDFFINYNLLSSESKVYFRAIKPGDKLNRKLLKRFFQNHKIPFWERSVWPVISTIDGLVLSVLGCDDCLKGEMFAIDKSLKKSIKLSYLQRMRLMELL
jgi:tRNA(Ile)-lysidine synthase